MYGGVIHEIAPVQELFKNPIHPYTKALMDSIPKMDNSLKRLKTLKGMVPSILDLGDKCKLCSRFDPDECACGGTKIEPGADKEGHFVRIFKEKINVSKNKSIIKVRIYLLITLFWWDFAEENWSGPCS